DPVGGEQRVDRAREPFALDPGLLARGGERGGRQGRLGRRRRVATAGHEQGWQQRGDEAREGGARHRRRFFLRHRMMATAKRSTGRRSRTWAKALLVVLAIGLAAGWYWREPIAGYS